MNGDNLGALIFICVEGGTVLICLYTMWLIPWARKMARRHRARDAR